jgi:hypothetical protein
MSQIAKLWNEDTDIDSRRSILSMYFDSPTTINKHCKKAWNDLPSGFKSYINRVAAERLFT